MNTAASQPRARFLWGLLVSLWALTVLSGMNMLWRYQSEPGDDAAAPERWPAATELARAPDHMTLLLFAHPRCTCTRASLNELSWLLDRHRDALTTHVIFMKPSETDPRWLDSDTYRAAGHMRGAHRFADHDGREARRFGAVTSGQALLYDTAGRLVFRGGITGARGHIGDNLGRARLVALLQHQSVDRSNSPVFGCKLGGIR